MNSSPTAWVADKPGNCAAREFPVGRVPRWLSVMANAMRYQYAGRLREKRPGLPVHLRPGFPVCSTGCSPQSCCDEDDNEFFGTFTINPSRKRRGTRQRLWSGFAQRSGKIDDHSELMEQRWVQAGTMPNRIKIRTPFVLIGAPKSMKPRDH